MKNKKTGRESLKNIREKLNKDNGGTLKVVSKKYEQMPAPFRTVFASAMGVRVDKTLEGMSKNERQKLAKMMRAFEARLTKAISLVNKTI